MKHLILIVMCLSASFIQESEACLWDRDTIRDELQLNPNVFDLLIGQFPHHGEDYYEWRLRSLSEASSKDDLNDKAVALIRLGEYVEARQLLLELLESNPDDYFTLSNLGVLEKKAGGTTQSVAYIFQALEIRPEGHLGVGDWYLKMLQWREKAAADQSQELNFLREPYEGDGRILYFGKPLFLGRNNPSLYDEKRERYDKLCALLQNDQTFADGFLVMGDFLAAAGDLNLAYVSYSRAQLLGHPESGVVTRRLNRIKDAVEYSKEKTTSKDFALFMAKGAEWMAAFNKEESRLLKLGITPDFDRVEIELKKQGIKRYAPSKSSWWKF